LSNPWDPIDTMHLGYDRVVAIYLVETADGLALVDTGPATTLPAVEAALATRGVALGDLRHLLLTHIHLDHAGASGTIVRRHPHIQVHVSEIGAPHVIDPSRLERSARQLYLDRFDTLWGELAPVPEANVRVVGDTVLGLECFPAPGHAKHHVAFLGSDGTMYCGDSAGVRIEPARHIVPASPPPDIDVEGWHRTIDEIERRTPDRLAIVHFGVKSDVTDHLTRLRERLDLFAARIGAGMTVEELVSVDRADLRADGSDDADLYERAGSLVQSHAGLTRYWAKRREREAAEAEAAAAAAAAAAAPAH
jgi:glyoxylase-like metal-dependent hydrolase (beta-lactamase superfamily II)